MRLKPLTPSSLTCASSLPSLPKFPNTANAPVSTAIPLNNVVVNIIIMNNFEIIFYLLIVDKGIIHFLKS